MKPKRALISVSDKTGLAEFAKKLQELGVEIISTGGTASFLEDNGIKVTPVSDVTGFPEILDGRVKTLHPKIFGGILAMRDNKEHLKQLADNAVQQVDIVIVNLYQFEKTVAGKDCSKEDAIENIDIGGPSLIRAAAKNHKDVAVLVEPGQYDSVMEELGKKGELSKGLMEQLARRAFERTAEYDIAISQYLQGLAGENLPEKLLLSFNKKQDLRYGENNFQQGALYTDPGCTGVSIPCSEQLHGKELSYNNILDINGAIDVVASFDQPCATILKHVNPCGVALADSISWAFSRALEADPMSAFGGIVGLNRKCDLTTAEQIVGHFIEVVVAPDYDVDALAKLKEKKNIRLIKLNQEPKPPGDNFIAKVSGGILLQTPYIDPLNPKELKVVTKKNPTDAQMKDLLFAYKVARQVKSNCIVLANDQRTVGVGAGQMSRVDAAMLACHKSKGKSKGSVLASDAFFPFRDGVDEAAKNGIKAIIQPGGSIRDHESIDAADEHGIAMVFTDVRSFKH